MPWWLALFLVLFGLVAMAITVGRSMRHRSEDISRINRTGLQDEDFMGH